MIAYFIFTFMTVIDWLCHFRSTLQKARESPVSWPQKPIRLKKSTVPKVRLRGSPSSVMLSCTNKVRQPNKKNSWQKFTSSNWHLQTKVFLQMLPSTVMFTIKEWNSYELIPFYIFVIIFCSNFFMIQFCFNFWWYHFFFCSSDYALYFCSLITW